MTRFAATLFAFGAVMAVMSVAADAFAAHGLAAVAPAMEQAVVWFKEGANFQMNHALGLMIVTAVAEYLPAGRPRAILRAAAVLLAASTVLFPFSLYAISFAGPGFFAPYGGWAAMLGWLLFAAGAIMAAARGVRSA